MKIHILRKLLFLSAYVLGYPTEYLLEVSLLVLPYLELDTAVSKPLLKMPKEAFEEPEEEASKGMSPPVLQRDVKSEGAALMVRHFTTHSQSMLVYATQMGFIHGWDLRSHREAWVFKVTPDLGFLTAMVLGADQVCVAIRLSLVYVRCCGRRV